MATNPLIPPPTSDNPRLNDPVVHAAFAAGIAHAARNAGTNPTGVSTPPDGGNVRSISPPMQDPSAHPAVPPIGAAPTPHASSGIQLEQPQVASTILPPPTPGAAPMGSMQAPQPIPGPDRGSIQGQENETARLIGSGSGASQIKNPVGRGLAEFGSAVGHIVAPGLAAEIPGTEDHNQRLIQQSQKATGALQGLRAADTADEEKQAQTGAIPSEVGLREAQTGAIPSEIALREAETQKDLTPPDPAIDKQTYDFLTKKLGMTPQEAYKEMQQEKGEPGREQTAQLRGDALRQQAQIAGENRKDRELFHADSERDRELTREQIRANAADKKNKPTADEQKRADLVDNLNENLGVVEEILKRRPELFGPMAGRMTELKASFGTSDPDIAALEAAQHQLGMVQQGVHGMRSAQGIQGAVDSVMNGFHNSPDAMARALQTVRSSAQTFSRAVGEKGQPGIGGVEAPGPKVGDVEDGYRFKGGNKGDPNNWEKVAK